MLTRSWLRLALVASLLTAAVPAWADPPRPVAAAAAPAPAAAAKFAPHQIEWGSHADLRAMFAGAPQAPRPSGAAAIAKMPAPAAHIAENAHLLVPGGSAQVARYARVVVTPTHVALVRHDGVIDVVRHEDASAQIARGTHVPVEKEYIATVGHTALRLEHGPGDTVRLYRQLPVAAKGEIASSYELTSFAIDHEDAFHPFGKPATTVSLAVPRAVYQGAVDTTHGGTGWSGGGIGIDVLGEVQIDTHLIKVLQPAPAAKPATPATPQAK